MRPLRTLFRFLHRQRLLVEIRFAGEVEEEFVVFQKIGVGHSGEFRPRIRKPRRRKFREERVVALEEERIVAGQGEERAVAVDSVFSKHLPVADFSKRGKQVGDELGEAGGSCHAGAVICSWGFRSS